MIDKVLQNPYNAVVDAYGAFNTSVKIRGTLVEKNEKDVKVDIGDNKILEATLKDKIDANVGDVVLIDKRDILKSNTVEASEVVTVDAGEGAILSETLQKLQVDVNEDNLKALKILQNSDIPINKENINSFVFSKNCLEDIVGKISYDAVIKLMDKEVDVENDSLQKISVALDEVKNEKEGFSLLKLFKKKEITTEEAEEISVKVYGSKMGKDVTDIIKALHKNDISITRKNIEKINDIFYKLNKLKDVSDKNFVDVLKNNISASIDNLYKVKNFVRKSFVDSVDKVSSISTKLYEKYMPKVEKVTEKDLRLMEQNIKDLLVDNKLENTEENVKLCKEFVKNNMPASKENIETIKEMKLALKEVSAKLDNNNAAILIKKGIDIEKIDIRELNKKLDESINPVKPSEEKANANTVIDTIASDNIISDKIDKIMDKVEKFKTIEDKDIIVLMKKDVDFKINKVEQVLFKPVKDTTVNEEIKVNYEKPIEKPVEKPIEIIMKNENIPINDENIKIVKALKKNDVNITNENVVKISEVKTAVKTIAQNVKVKDIQSLVKEDKDITKIDVVKLDKQINELIAASPNNKENQNLNELVNKIEATSDVSEDNIVSLLKNNLEFTIENINTALGKGEDKVVQNISRVVQILNDIKDISYINLAIQLRNNTPITLKNIQNAEKTIKSEPEKVISKDNEKVIKKYVSVNLPMFENKEETKVDITKSIQVAKALIVNSLSVSRQNITRMYEAYGQFNNIKENLSLKMIQKATVNNLDLENTPIEEVSDFVNENKGIQSEDAKKFTNKIMDIGKEKEVALATLIKNNKPINLYEIQKVCSAIKNKNTFGHEVDDIIKFVQKNNNPRHEESTENVKKTIKAISKQIKEGKLSIAKSYEALEDSMKEIKDNVKFQDEKASTVFEKKYKEVMDNLENKNVYFKEEKLIQMPYYMNEQFTNLNMFFRDRKNTNKDTEIDEMEVVLSLDTKNMGNINLKFNVDKSKVNLKLDVDKPEDKELFSSLSPKLKALLGDVGFELGELSFDEENNLVLNREEATKPYIKSSGFDLKI